MTTNSHIRNISEQVHELEGAYRERNRRIGNDLALIGQQEEPRTQDEDAEHFVGNDARTTWNMGTFLLQPRPLLHKIEPLVGSFTDRQLTASRILETRLKREWDAVDKKVKKRGKNGFWWQVVGWMLASGWYAIPFALDKNAFFLDYWEPTQSYPEYDDDGLVRLARIRTMSLRAARRLAKRQGWDESVLRAQQTNVKVSQLWLDEGDTVFMGVIADNDKLLRPLQRIGTRIPVLTGAAGGIPANKSLVTEFGGHDLTFLVESRDESTAMGQSILETNKSVAKNFNRQMSFLQQLLHDTANPKTWERPNGNNRILRNPMDWFKRGAHFVLGREEEMGIFPAQPIPVELTNLQFSLRNMLQRGGINDAVFGNITGELNSILVSQITESTGQVVKPYHDACIFLATEVNEHWYSEMQRTPPSLLTPLEREALQELKSVEVSVRADYSLKIPGDLAQRLNMAKFSSPEWELSPETAFDMLVPEVTDVEDELARIRVSKAQADPIFAKLDTIQALRDASNRLGETNPQRAGLYSQVADLMLAQITQRQPGPRPDSTGLSPGIIPSSIQARQGGTTNGTGA